MRNLARAALTNAVNRAIANGAPRYVEIPTMEAKLERLLRFHRSNAFSDNPAEEARHDRALARLKRTATYRAMVETRAAHSAYLESERLLRMWA